MSDSDSGNRRRRDIIKYTGAASLIGLAGCSGDGSDGGSDGSDGGSDGGSGSNYPEQPVKLVIPFSQGGGTDTINRQTVPALSDNLGVNVQIENVPGAASMRGTSQALRADPDGYTMLAFNPPSTPISYLVNQPDFDLTEVQGVAAYAIAPAVVTLNPDVADEHNIESYGDLIAAYQDGTLEAFAGQSIGSYFHVMALIMKERHGLDFDSENYIAYDGTGPAVEAVASGEAPAGIGIDTATLSFTEDDRLRVPTILTSEGSAAYPDTQTVTELDYENMDSVGQVTRCYWMPPGTSQEKIDIMSSAVEEMVNDEEVQQYAEESGQQLLYRGPDYADSLLNEILNEIPNEVDLESIRDQISN
jgi:tripartite-type tricarboxylate transporter receptor subunit TctC